jgi:hypothetical protein
MKQYAIGAVIGLLSWMPYLVYGQQDPTQPTQQAVNYPPFTAGMRIQVGQAVLPRNTPSLNGTCGSDNHPCSTGDAVPPSTFGVVQPDAPVLDPAGWYWSKIAFDNGINGWVSAYPPYINPLTPPQMIAGSSFSVVGDYNGPALTQGVCINDGLASAATLQLQVNATGQQGTMICPQKAPGTGNHKIVVQAVNSAGTAASTEFQYSVTSAPIPVPPTAPSSLRIAPVGGATATQRIDTATPAVNKPTAEKPAAPATAKPTPEKK